MLTPIRLFQFKYLLKQPNLCYSSGYLCLLMKKYISIIVIVFFVQVTNAQKTIKLIGFSDTLSKHSIREILSSMDNRRLQIKSLVIPAALTSYGFIALKNNRLKLFDDHIKEEVWTEHPHQPVHFDDGLQYIPGFSVYVLNGLGIRGKNNLLDATRLMMMIVVQSFKKITSLRRPDGFGSNTFPSGHTSTAFVAAEFLNQEYKDQSPLYSITGYAMAAIVGYMRIYNNRHWFKDVVTGAGIGIGVTKFVYWIYPSIKRKFFKDKPANTMIMPYYQKGNAGISLVHHLY
jgi:PAP2 superfamily